MPVLFADTAGEFACVVVECGRTSVMEDPGARRDNVFVESVGRSVKHGSAYPKACDSLSVARTDIADNRDWYKTHCPHPGIDLPDEPDGLRLARLALVDVRHSPELTDLQNLAWHGDGGAGQYRVTSDTMTIQV